MDFLYVLFGLIIGYFVVSLTEAFIHKNILHASGATIRLWKKYPIVFQGFLKAYYIHNVIHHRETYKTDYITQFSSEAARLKLDSELKEGLKNRVWKEKYGLTLAGIGNYEPLVFLIPSCTLIVIFFNTPVIVGAMVPMLLFPFILRTLHPYLHMKYDNAIASAPWYLKWLIRTSYVQYMFIYHYLHHKYPIYNYNLNFFGGDLFFGNFKKRSEQDTKEMEKLGLIKYSNR